jgi:hypothetical protein
MFATDLVVSVIVFVFIVNLSLIIWNTAYESETRFNEEHQLRERVVRTSDLLVRSPGYPQDWTANTVKLAGFAERNHRIGTAKLREFNRLRYSQQRKVIRAVDRQFYLRATVDGRPVDLPVLMDADGIGTERVAYIAEEQQDISQADFLDSLNRSDVRWDLYWPSTNGGRQLESFDASTVYNYTDQGDVMFADMVDNLSETYGTVISEDVNIGLNDIGNEDDLKTWVEEGGTYIHTGEKGAFIRDLFGLDETGIQGDGNGTVTTVHPLLNHSLDTGDFVEFEDEIMAFGNVSTMYVNDTAHGPPPTRCLGCHWNIDYGDLYYLNDVRADGDSPNHTIGFGDADNAFRGLLTATFGRPPANDADTVVTSERSVLIKMSTNDTVAAATVVEEQIDDINPQSTGLVGRDDGAILYGNESSGDLRAGEAAGSTLYGVSGIEALGPGKADIDGDGSTEVPFVNGSAGNIWIVDRQNETEKLFDADRSSEAADDSDTRIGVGRWQSDTVAVFFTDQEHEDIVRVFPNGTSSVIASPSDGTNAVSGVADIDDDGVNELIFADGSQHLRYLEPNGTVTRIDNGGAGSNNGIGIGSPGQYLDDGIQVPLVDGSNEVKLVNGTGAVTTLVDGGAGKQPVASADVDGDGDLEIAYRDPNTSPPTAKLIDNVADDPAVRTVTIGGTGRGTVCTTCSTAVRRGILQVVLWQ